MKTNIPEKIETKQTQEIKGKDAHERLIEKEKIRLCYNALSSYSTAQYFGAIAEDKLQQVDAGECLEIVDGRKKSMKILYWEAVKFRRLYLDHIKAYKELLDELQKLGFAEKQMIDYGQQRGITIDKKENLYIDGDE